MKQDADAVCSICRDRISGELLEVVSQYAIGGNGDNSVVVKDRLSDQRPDGTGFHASVTHCRQSHL